MNFSGVVVDPVFDLADRLRRYLAEVGPLREPPADHFIQIFVCCQGIQDEIDTLFIERLPAVLDLELAQADALKTLSGKRKRWNGIVQTLEKCERVSGSAVEDAIAEAEAKVFLLLEEGTDWSKEPVDIDFGPSETVVVESLKKAALKAAIERGIPEDQARDIIEKTIRNKKSGQG